MNQATYRIQNIDTDHVTNGYAFVPTDWEKVERIMQSDYIPERLQKGNHDPVQWTWMPLQRELSKFLASRKGDCLRVEYSRRSHETSIKSAKPDAMDRAYAKGSISAGNMAREVRAAVYHGTMLDFDQCSSAHSMILSALKADRNSDTEYENIEHYVENKKEERKRIADTYFGGDLERAKNVFTKILFGGNPQIDDGLVKGMQEELQAFTEHVIASADRQLIDKVKRRTEKKNRDDIRKACAHWGIDEDTAKARGYGLRKWQASLVCLWTRNKESLVMEAVLGWAIRNNLILNRRFDYCFDGVLLPMDDVVSFMKYDAENKTIDDLLKTFRKVGLEQTGFDVRWEVKDMQPEHDKFWAEHGAFEKACGVNEDIDHFDLDHMLQLKSTGQRLAYFNEHFHWIEDQHKAVCFQVANIKRHDGTSTERNLLWASQRELTDTFGHISSLQKNKHGEDIPLVQLWLRMESRSQYHRIGAYPYAGCYDADRASLQCKKIFNVFTGYPSDVWENASDTEFSKEEMTKLLYPFMGVASHLVGCKCFDEQGCFPVNLDAYDPADRMQLDLLLHYIGHRIAHPDHPRHPYYICIQSECGTGKNTLMEPLQRLVGSNHYKCSADMEAFCGAHAEGLISKIIAVFNEANINDTKKYVSKFKEYVTEDTQTANPKFVRPFEFALYAAIIILTNERVPMRIEPMNRERRMILFKSNTFTAQYWGSDMWKRIYDSLADIRFLRALRQYFTTLDYDAFDMRVARQANLKLPAYRQLALHFTPVEVAYLRSYIEEGAYSPLHNRGVQFWTLPQWDQPIVVPVAELWSGAKRFYEEQNMTSAATMRSKAQFTQQLEQLPGIEKHVDPHGVRHLRFVPKQVYRDLIDKCLVDIDSMPEGFNAAMSGEVVAQTKKIDPDAFFGMVA